MRRRVVLYAQDMEPITVIDLSESTARYLEERGQAQLEVMMPVRLTTCTRSEDLVSRDIRRILITAELLIRNGHRHYMLFTSDDETAMLLRSTLLPGQRRDVNEDRRREFVRGFVEALNILG